MGFNSGFKGLILVTESVVKLNTSCLFLPFVMQAFQTRIFVYIKSGLSKRTPYLITGVPTGISMCRHEVNLFSEKSTLRPHAILNCCLCGKEESCFIHLQGRDKIRNSYFSNKNSEIFAKKADSLQHVVD